MLKSYTLPLYHNKQLNSGAVLQCIDKEYDLNSEQKHKHLSCLISDGSLGFLAPTSPTEISNRLRILVFWDVTLLLDKWFLLDLED